MKPPIDFNGIKLSSIEDIACTKLQTIGMRGSKKDFIDLFFILNKYSLDDLFSLMEKKYDGVEYNQIHILKSLVYFENTEGQPNPRMVRNVDWNKVKQKLISVTKSFRLS